jgi:hypothetical protein
LESRESIGQLPESDYKYLAGDIKRTYILIVHEWLRYVKHLKENFLYLFSLAMRMNPFDQRVSPVVQ